MSRQRSEDIFQQAQQLMPGGVNSPARAFGAVGGQPIVIDAPESDAANAFAGIAGEIARKLSVMAINAPAVADANITWVTTKP